MIHDWRISDVRIKFFVARRGSAAGQHFGPFEPRPTVTQFCLNCLTTNFVYMLQRMLIIPVHNSIAKCMVGYNAHEFDCYLMSYSAFVSFACCEIHLVVLVV